MSELSYREAVQHYLLMELPNWDVGSPRMEDNEILGIFLTSGDERHVDFGITRECLEHAGDIPSLYVFLKRHQVAKVIEDSVDGARLLLAQGGWAIRP